MKDPIEMTLEEFEKSVTQETEDKYFKEFSKQARYYGHGVYGWHTIKADDTRKVFLLGIAAREGVCITEE